MHAVLYAGLATMAIWILELAISWSSLGIVVLAGLVVGLIQEALQMFTGVQVWGWNTFFDLGIYSLGMLIGLGLMALGKRIRHPEQKSASLKR